MITGTVTQAAEILYISQPAVSRMLSDLEHAIGFKLFTRANRTLIPTDEGRAFYDEVERAFVGLDQIMNAAHAIRDFRSGYFRLITIPSLASTVMAELVAKFAERYPTVSVSLEVQPSLRVFEWIVSQQCDIGLSTLPIENPAITTRPVTSGDAVCILPKNHRLVGRARITPSDLEGEPFISFKADSIFRHQVDEIFKKAGVRRSLKLEARTMEAIYGLVAAGLGVSVIGPVFPGNELRHRIATRPFKPRIPIELALLYSTHKPLSRFAECFVEIVDEFIGNSPARVVDAGNRKDEGVRGTV
jgi:DNA-binding transcriptional LysR family regulator